MVKLPTINSEGLRLAKQLGAERVSAVKRLTRAIEETERDHPLPRCHHGNCLMDGGGEVLEPPCGCRFQGRS